MKHKIVLLLVAAALVALVAVRVASVRRAAAKPAEHAPEAALVTTARAARADVPDRASVTGTVRPRNEVEIVSKVAGRIQSVHARVGDRVQAGALLAVVEHEDLAWAARQAEANVSAARAGVDGAQLELGRIQALFAGGSAAPAQLDAARVKLELSRAQLAQAEAAAGLARQKLADARIVAPFAGTVTRRPVDVGAQVGLQTPLFTLQDAAVLKLETSVDAAAFVRLARGSAAAVSVDALPGETFAGKVTLLSPSVDAASRRAAVEIEIADARGRLLPNLFARAELTLGVLPDVVVVPREAVLETAGGAVLFRIEGGRARAVQARLGPGDGGRVAVLSGIAEHDEVATSGLPNLTDGAPVRVAPSTAGARAEAR